MITCRIALLLGVCCFAPLISGQYAPGVNPQVYNQGGGGGPPMSQQQAQQIQLQQQQIAMQQQQQRAMQQQQGGGPPMQQQHIPQQQLAAQGFQPPPQQVHPGQPQHGRPPPPAAHHGGHGPPHGQQVYNAQQMHNERDHIAEHVGAPVDTSKMSEQELQFHYFKMHDADNNNKLDGCELVKSLIHWHDQANHDPKSGTPMPDPKIFTDAELLAMIDPILDQDDRNRDGFIDYPEFIQAQQASSGST